VSDDAPFKENRAAQRARQAEADEALVGALSRVARAVAAEDPSGPSPSAWHRLARARTEPARSRRPLVWAAVGVATCASALATFEIVRLVRPAPLTYDVRGVAQRGVGPVEAGPQGTEINFSDGTEIQLEAKARLTVSAAGPHGARLRLQEGGAHFQVMHLPHAAWTVEAGPYVVEVTGTEFDVRWSEGEQTVEVKMRSGSVRVSGPLLSERVTLRKGQHLLARLGMGDVRIDDGRSAQVVAPAAIAPAALPSAPPAVAAAEPSAEVAAAPAAPVVLPPPAAPAARPVRNAVRPRAPRRIALTEPAVEEDTTTGRALPPSSPFEPAPFPGTTPAPSRAERPKWSARNWSGRVAAGDAASVVADAEQVGLDTTMRQADAADLGALADAARYAGRSELAERAFSVTRRRFPGSSRAHTAAFLLGRMADDRGDARAGLAWYRAYLGETPSGPYAAEALGRAMLIVERLQGREAAVPIAREYLGRFPNGTYLLQARALVDDR